MSFVIVMYAAITTICMICTVFRKSKENRQLVKDSLIKSGQTGSSVSCISDKIASAGKVKDRKLPIPTTSTMDNGITAQSSAALSMTGYAASTSSVVETHRRHLLEQVRKKFGEYGEPFLVGEYKEFKKTSDMLRQQQRLSHQTDATANNTTLDY